RADLRAAYGVVVGGGRVVRGDPGEMGAARLAAFRLRTAPSARAGCLGIAEPPRPDRSGAAPCGRWRLAAARASGPTCYSAESRQKSGAAGGAPHRGVSGGCAGVGGVSPSQGRLDPARGGSAEPGPAIESGGAAPGGIDPHGKVDPGLLPTRPRGPGESEL